MARLVLADYRNAPIGEALRATLGLLEKVTLAHEMVGPNDVRAVLETGATKEQIRDALYVAFLFNGYDRLADSLGWELPQVKYYLKAGQFLLKQGYR